MLVRDMLLYDNACTTMLVRDFPWPRCLQDDPPLPPPAGVRGSFPWPCCLALWSPVLIETSSNRPVACRPRPTTPVVRGLQYPRGPCPRCLPPAPWSPVIKFKKIDLFVAFVTVLALAHGSDRMAQQAADRSGIAGPGPVCCLLMASLLPNDMNRFKLRV